MFSSRRAHWNLALPLGFLALLLGAAWFGFRLLDAQATADLAAAEAHAFEVNRASSRAAERQVERLLEITSVLHGLASAAWLRRPEGRPMDSAALETALAEMADSGGFGILQVAVIDSNGILGWSNLPGLAGADFSDREHIRQAILNPAVPVVSEPLIGRSTLQWTIQIVRAIRRADGSVAGVAVVSVDPNVVSAGLAGLHNAPGNMATLLRQDGTILARSVEAHRYLGQKVSAERLQAFQSSDEGTARSLSVTGDYGVLLAWQHVRNWPLVVFFGQDERPLLAAHQARWSARRLGLVLAFGAVGAGGLLVINMLARRRDRAELRRVEARRQDMADLLAALPGISYRALIRWQSGFEQMHLHLGPHATARFGLPPDLLTDMPSLKKIVGEEQQPARLAFARQVHETGEAVNEFRATLPDGRFVWVRDACRVIHRPNDDVAEVVGLMSDITAERNIKAQAIASAQLATLGEMATGVAHELNQPCAVIGLAADVAALEMDRGGAAPLAAARGRLDEILRQTERMQQIIDQFRAFGRSDKGPEEAVDLEAVVRSALLLARGILHSASIKVDLNLPPHLPAVWGRRVALEQVLMNLLLNARDAMADTPRPERRVEIWAEATGQGVGLHLRDHGHGIAPEHQDRLFEPFFSTRPVGRGTGLGLALAYGTIMSFGGTITLENHPEGGAVADIGLRVAAPAPALDSLDAR